MDAKVDLILFAVDLAACTALDPPLLTAATKMFICVLVTATVCAMPVLVTALICVIPAVVADTDADAVEVAVLRIDAPVLVTAVRMVLRGPVKTVATPLIPADAAALTADTAEDIVAGQDDAPV